VGSSPTVRIWVVPTDWTLSATLRRAGTQCGRNQSAPPTRVADGEFTLSPVGPAASYDVDLFATSAGSGGDMATTFRWTTPIDGPMPEPEARVSVLAGHDGQTDSYGVELQLVNLAKTPKKASATITVIPAQGERTVIRPPLVPTSECNPPGSVRFEAPDEVGRTAAVGTSPFRYEVRLRLDGKSHRAVATWPDDEDPDYAPFVPLVFDPPLPAL
jgi:hypothetical protein